METNERTSSRGGEDEVEGPTRADGAAATTWTCEGELDRTGLGLFARGVTLRLELGGAATRSVTLEPGRSVVLGSGSEADVVLDDRTVSARHCRVERVAARVLVTDLGSKNGVVVGGARVAEASLAPGGAFALGRVLVALLAGGVGGELAAAPAEPPLPGLVGTSEAMLRLAASVRRAARHTFPILLRGETGTGKELVARALHEESARARGPLVCINAAAVARDLADSELFGHRRGAFTGAVSDHAGAFREAHGGTLFLDEVGALPLETQAKLLRVLEDGAVRPVGGEGSRKVDVRVLAATCEPLERMVEHGAFRRDLYERLAVAIVRVPALRERIADLPALARHLLRASGLAGVELACDAVALLATRRFPGNVRELRNVLVQAALRAGRTIRARDVRAALEARGDAPRPRLTPDQALVFLDRYGGNVSRAAREAAVPRSTLRDLLRAARAQRG